MLCLQQCCSTCLAQLQVRRGQQGMMCCCVGLPMPRVYAAYQLLRSLAAACCCLTCSASACSCGSLPSSCSCTCLPRLLLLRAVSAVMGSAAKMKMLAADSPVDATSLIAIRPAAGVSAL